jgi:hypothetical protein
MVAILPDWEKEMVHGFGTYTSELKEVAKRNKSKDHHNEWHKQIAQDEIRQQIRLDQRLFAQKGYGRTIWHVVDGHL